MEKNWEDRFELGKTASRPPRWVVLLLFPIFSIPFLWAVLMVYSVLGHSVAWWISTPAVIGIGGMAIFRAYRFGKLEMLRCCTKFFLLGAAVGLLCPLLLELAVLPGAWWALLGFTVWPSWILGALIGVPVQTPSDRLVYLGISGLGNAICYAILGRLLFVKRAVLVGRASSK